MRSLSRRLGVLLFGLTAVAACSDSSGPSNGSLTLLLKDAPGDIKAAVVTIDQINLQGTGGTTVLRDTPVTTDLLTLVSSVNTLIDDHAVAAGTYSELRFVISGAYIEVENSDGSTSIYASSPTYAGLPPGATVAGQLQMPSFPQSGLKVTLPGDALVINGGDQKILVLDFDVSQSFGQVAGGSGMWVMHPVITGAEVTSTGSARIDLTLGAGITLPAGTDLTGFTATLTGSDGVPRTLNFVAGATPGTFSAEFLFLAPGNYSVTLTAPAGITAFTTDPALPGTVSVVANQSSSASFVITSAS
jgi:uncharacterized protein DUF4382